MTVLSSLGQPLNAEIELSATKEELSTMQVRIANAEAYRRANLEYSAFVGSVRLGIEQRRDGSLIIRATSARAVNDPFVELLVEVIWSSGRLMREYTSLIDPPGFTVADSVAPPVAPPAAASRPAIVDPRPVASAPLEPPPPPPPPAAASEAARPAPVAKPPPRAARPPAEPVAAAPAAAGSDTYGPVQRGDTLGKIADSVRPSGVSLDQMLVSLFRENKDAFAGNNMNRLRTGVVLRVPDATAAAATPASEAAREVRAQAADFNAYRQRLAGAVQDAPPVADGGQVATGRIAPKVEEKAPAPAAGADVLRLSKGDPAKGGAGRDAKAALAAREEDNTAREKALREANDRVASLEKMLKDAQRLLEIQSKQLAELQKLAKAEPPRPEPAKAAEVKPEPVKPEPAKAEVKPEPVPPAPPVPAEPAPAVADAPPAPVADAKPPVEAPKPKPVPPPPPPPPPAPSFIDQAIAFVSDYMLELGGGLLALLGLGWLAGRRKKGGKVDSRAEAATATRVDAPEPRIEPMPAASAGIDPMMATQAGLEEVDPLAEADVYLTYGRDTQAEEILREAIAKYPGRHELHLKLLEIYMKRADARSFESVATQLFASTGGQGADWLKASEMGATIDPSNPLYAAGKTSVESSGANLATVAGGAAAAAVAATAAAVTTSGTRAPIDIEKTQILTVEDTKPAAMASVDFDFEPATTGSPAAPVEIEQTVLDIASGDGRAALTETDMDFTLDFGTPGTQSVPELPDLPLEASSEGTSTAEADLMFEPVTSTTAGAGVEPGMVDPMYQSQATNVLLDSGPPTGSILDFKLEAARAEAAEAAQMAGAGQPTIPPLQDTMIMANPGELVTFDMTHPAGLPQNWQETTLPRVDLDLGETSPDGRNPNKDEHWNDVNTKYDLAKAYEEMGDKDGAREILREVIAEGDAQQKADAESMLARLG